MRARPDSGMLEWWLRKRAARLCRCPPWPLRLRSLLSARCECDRRPCGVGCAPGCDGVEGEADGVGEDEARAALARS